MLSASRTCTPKSRPLTIVGNDKNDGPGNRLFRLPPIMFVSSLAVSVMSVGVTSAADICNIAAAAARATGCDIASSGLRDGGVGIVGFTDGHAKAMRADYLLSGASGEGGDPFMARR